MWFLPRYIARTPAKFSQKHVRGVGQGEARHGKRRGLNLAVVKLLTKLSLYRKMEGMICFAEPGSTENLYNGRDRTFNNMLYMRYAHLTECQAYS
jgi:hypothetical protein